MKRLIIAAALMAVSAGTMASQMTCSYHGKANTFEAEAYSDYVKVNGVDMKQAGRVKQNSNGDYQVGLNSAYQALDGNHTAVLIYHTDIKHPVAVIDLDGVSPDMANGGYSADEVRANYTACGDTYRQLEETNKQKAELNAQYKKQQEQQAAYDKQLAEQKKYVEQMNKEAAEQKAKEEAKEEAAKTW